MTKMKKQDHKVRGVALLLAFSMLWLGGCGSKEAETVQEEPSEAPVMVEAGIESMVAQEGGQLISYVPAISLSLNPLYPDDHTTEQLLTLCYEPLISYDGNLRLMPGLAESWDIEDEGRVWMIHLRQDVLWHDGTPFTSADVVATIGLLQSSDYEASPYAHRIDAIAEYTAINDHTVRIVAKTPGILTLHALTFPVVSAHAFARGQKPVGTGPYALTRADTKKGFQFDVNINWWRTPPYIKRILAKRMADETEAFGSLTENSLNFVSSHSLTTGSFREEGHVSIVEIASQQMECMLVNHRSQLLQNVNIRKVIAYGINRRDIISKAYLGHAFATDVPVQPDSWYYNSDSKKYDYNPNRAMEILSEEGWVDLNGDGMLERNRASGLPEQLSVRILVNETPENTVRKDAASIIKTNLETLGFGVELVEKTWSNSDSSYLKALQSGDFDLALFGVYLDKSPDLSVFLSRNGEHNYGAYSSAKMDACLEAVNVARTEEEMLTAMNGLQKAFTTEVPFIQLYFRTASVLFNDTLAIDGISSLREEMPFTNIERWHFDEEGRSLFPVFDAWAEGAEWSRFDQNWPQDARSTESSDSATITDTAESAAASAATPPSEEEGGLVEVGGASASTAPNAIDQYQNQNVWE